MAITGPEDLPYVFKIKDTDPIKKYVITQLGGSSVRIELHEDQFETNIRVAADWISQYFPREQRLAVFNTQPLQATYPLPKNAYWIQEVAWSPTATVADIFGAESYLFNIGQVSGVDQALTDYHLLQAYRKTASKILATEGHWEVINEGGEGPGNQVIRLYPTPKGSFPVVVMYMPVVTHFRSPEAKLLLCDYITAKMKKCLGMVRRKVANMPSPTGGTLATDGAELIAEADKELEEITKRAIELGEPMHIYVW